MEITIQRLDAREPFHLRASNDFGNTVDIDGAPEIGGANQGMRPMQLLLTSMGTCSGMDIIHLLRKQRQELRDIRISVKANRAETHPRVFTEVHLHFDLYGNLDTPKVERAVSLSVEKYCTAIRMVEKVATVTYSYAIHP